MVQRQSRSVEEPEAGVAGVLLAAAAFGLLAGLAEVVIQLIRRLGLGRLSLFGPDLVWMAPLADVAVFVVVAAVYVALMTVFRPLRRPAVAVGCFAALAAGAAVANVEGLHWAAVLLLGLGVGSVVGRSRVGQSIPGARMLLAPAGVVLILGIGVRFSGDLLESQARARLGPPLAGRPNVLLLVLDTVRAWNLGLYGYGRATTPALQRRFADATVFNRAIAASPWTLPSHASMFTGRLPTDVSANWESPLDDAAPTLAEALSRAGYAAGGFVGNFRYTGRSTGLARGFVHYEDYPISWDEALRMTAIARRFLRLPSLEEWLGKNRILEARPAANVNHRFLRWLDGVKDRPFFAFLNYVDAHSPYLPPAPYDTMWSRAGADPQHRAERYEAILQRRFGPGPMPPELLTEYLDGYDGAIRYLDTQIDSLFLALDARGLLANTAVVLVGDHGEHFGEHGLIQHGNSLYLPLLHVPFVVWWPGHVPAVRVGAPVSLRDVGATVLDLAGVANPGLEGRSVAALWGPDSLHAPLDPIASAVDWRDDLSRFPPSPLLAGSLRSVLVDSLHYIRRADGTEELYDLSRDFLETRNLAGYPPFAPLMAGVRARLDSIFHGELGPRPH
jgi:arylsulfatase A-like enzyme